MNLVRRCRSVVLTLSCVFVTALISAQQLPETIESRERQVQQPRVIATPYGDILVTEPILLDLFDHPVMHRIKDVQQYGAQTYVMPQKFQYTRYAHCVGVWALLRLHGASLEEQIAGLLHDVSHTVFSHVGDLLYGHRSEKSSYQDNIHDWYLTEQGVDKVLARHDFTLADVSPKSSRFGMLERDLPDLCMDRIEYILQAGLLTNMLTQAEVDAIVQDIAYDFGRWYFKNRELAKKFAAVALYNTKHVWGGPEIYFIDRATAGALRRALDIKLLTERDIHFSVDSAVWATLLASQDTIIQEHLYSILNYKQIITTCPGNQGGTFVQTKFRGVDPFVRTVCCFVRLTDLDQEYRGQYEATKKEVQAGWSVIIDHNGAANAI